jgi:hypothetical protein
MPKAGKDIFLKIQNFRGVVNLHHGIVCRIVVTNKKGKFSLPNSSKKWNKNN